MDKDVADLMRLDRAIFSPVQNIWPYKERKGGRPRAKWLESMQTDLSGIGIDNWTARKARNVDGSHCPAGKVS